jgi:hypothetical protein
MSYDIELVDPVTLAPLEVDFKHGVHGGVYEVGGTQRLWLNVTYNYCDIFCKVMGPEGIRILYRKTGAETIPLLKEAISKLGDDVSDDYWFATEGNAKRALCGLLAFAQMRPDGLWQGD